MGNFWKYFFQSQEPVPLWALKGDMRSAKKVDFLDFLLVFFLFFRPRTGFYCQIFCIMFVFSVRNAYQLFFTTFGKNFFQ